MKLKKYKDIEIGDKYNELTVVGYYGRIKKGKRNQRHWICDCSCGTKGKIIDEMNLKNGCTKSCGCLITKNREKSHLEKVETFEQWCLRNDKQWALELWDYELNSCNPNDISAYSHKKIYFKCRNHNEKHHSESKMISNFTRQGDNTLNCSQCNSFGQYLINTYGEKGINMYWDSDKNTINPMTIPKASSNIKVWIKCPDKSYHPSNYITCSEFYSGNRCPYCASRKIHKYDSLGYKYPISQEIWSDKNKESVLNYSPHSNKKVWWKCFNKIHDDFYKDINDMVRDHFHCPECSKLLNQSNLQEKVYRYLKRLGYNVNTEYACTFIPTNPKTNYKLPYDNEIPELNLIIEVMGIQHYKITNFTKLSAQKKGISFEEEFQYSQWKDSYKKEQALLHGYNYIAIPYWSENNDEYKKIINAYITNFRNNIA